MAPLRRARADRTTRLLMAILAVSVIVGIAATFLAAPASTFGGGPGRGPVSDTWQITEAIGLGIFAFALGGMILYRFLAPNPRTDGSAYATPVAIFLVTIAFLALLHFVATGPADTTTVNDTQAGPPPPNDTVHLPGNVTLRPLPVAPGIPGWLGYVGLAIAILVAVLLLAPILRPPPPEPRDRTEPVRRSLEHALHALAQQDASDARGIIIGLYARLLDAVAPYLDELASATPREIERICIDRFGIASEHAHALTGLFEEARYSSHPFTDLQVERARTALAAALADLHLRPRAMTA